METSLRVIVRARPMNTREMKEGANRCVEYYEATGQIVINGASTFAYDKVYPDTIDQETIYTQSAHPMLDHVFGGFNATILAYGQTGSGKTYTMGTEDSDGTDELRRGIIPRLVDNLFKRIGGAPVPEAYKVTVSMYEIYGEHIYDLLRADKVKLTVHGDEKGCKIVNLTNVPVTDLRGALKQLEVGCHYRTKASTAMNAMSSRSHAVFTVLLEKSSVPNDESSFSAKLQLVDLAGSERLKKTEAAGHVMREGISINGGLLILSQVITALVTKQSYVPYRNSALTRVLQDSLGGNSYTVFLACISPADTNSQETLSTLRYADRAKQIKNKPIINKNAKAEEVSALRAQIKRLEKENADLKNGIAPNASAPEQTSNTVEIMALKDELLKKDDQIREKCITLSDCIVRLNSVTNKNIRLESDKNKLAATLTEVQSILTNEQMLEASEVVQMASQLVGAEIETTILGEEENCDESQVGMDESVYDAERLPELQTQLDAIEKEIAMKDANREKELETQKEFIEAMQQREEERTQLAMRVGELETEITKLRTDSRKVNVASKLAEERRQKLKELEKQHEEDKRKLLEYKKLQETRKKMEEAMKKTEDELKNLKLQRVRLLKEQRAEASKFKSFKQKHEREMQQIKTKLQKREIDVAKQKRIDEQRFAVLQQRLAESNRANKALKDLNAKRANRKDSPADPTALQALVEEELELEAASQKCQNLCHELRRQRGEIQRQIDQLEEQPFVSGKKRRLNDDPNVSVLMEGEEEFEESRQRKLHELRMSLEDINAEIKDLLKNSTISDDEKTSKSSKWAKVPADIRPVFETIFAQALTHVKKSVDLEFEMNKQKNDFKAKIDSKTKQDEKKKQDDEEMRIKYRQLTENLEEAKSGVHQHISFILGLIKREKIDDAALARFEMLRNQYCDVEQKIKKARRRTTHVMNSLLTPKPELKRNERSRKAFVPFGNVVSSADLTLGDAKTKANQKRSSIDVNKTSEDLVKRRVAMSPIRFDDETKLSEEDENEMETDDGIQILGSTFVKDSSSTSSPSQCQNGTFVIAPLEDVDMKSTMVTKRRSRRTDLGPVN